MNVNVNAVPLHSIIAPVLDDQMTHSHALLRGHLAVREVAHQGAVLGLWWSDQDDTELDSGLPRTNVNVVLMRGALSAFQADQMTHSHALLFRHFQGAMQVVVVSMTMPDDHQGDVSHD